MLLFLRSLPVSLQTAVHDASKGDVREKVAGKVAGKVSVLDTCTFNPQTHTIRIQVAPSRLARRLDIAEQIGRRTFLLCLDVSGSMSHHATEMVRVLQQIEGELMQLQSFVRIRLLFFSGDLLGETPLGDLASVCKKSGWLGGTEFGPPLHECLKEVKANPDTEHTVLFMTDGCSGYVPWEDAADELVRQPNVKVISVGFGNNFNLQSLRRLAGNQPENMRQFSGDGASGRLHDLLQQVVGCGIVLPTFAGTATVGGHVIPTTFHPFSTDDDETGIHACVPLPSECAPGATIVHVVDDLVPDTHLTVITSDAPDRSATILALHHALSAMRQSASADTAKQLRRLAGQLQHLQANDRRITEVLKCVEQLSDSQSQSLFHRGNADEGLGTLQSLERFVHALLSGVSVSARQIKMVQKATQKLDAMMAHLAKAVDIMDSTRELAFEPRRFVGNDTLGADMKHASDQYPALLVRSAGGGGYETEADYKKHISAVAEAAVTLIQPGTLCAPEFGGVMFPSELATNPSQPLDELLRALRTRTVDAILCASQATPAEREYTRRMYRIVAALLSMGVPTCAGTSLCWNLGSAAIHAMATAPLITTTLMSYFRAFMVDQQLESAMIGLYRTQPIRLYALTNRDDSPFKIENIWMSAAVFYCLEPDVQRSLLRPFGQGLVFESLRHAVNARVKGDPSAIQDLLTELVSTLRVGGARYTELDASADENQSTALWATPVDDAPPVPPDERSRGVFESLRRILRDSPVASKTPDLLAQMRSHVAFQCPAGMSTSMTRHEVDSLLLRVLGSTQLRENTVPYWGGVGQLLTICNGMSYVATTTDASVYGYISPDECRRRVEHTPFAALSELYDSVDEFVGQVVYLLQCGCSSGTIRGAIAPPTLDALAQTLLQRPTSAALVEKARMSAFSRNLVAWATGHWSADEVVALYAAVGGGYTARELVENAHRLAVQFQSPRVFGDIVRFVDVGELQPDAPVRRLVDERLREPFYAPTAGTLLVQIATRLEKGKSAHPILGSKRFNSIMGKFIGGLMALLGLPPVADGTTLTTITLEQFLDAKRKSPTDPLFKAGCAYYLQNFRSISFYTHPVSGMVFVEKVGDLLERHVAIENRKPIYIWGVSEMFGLSRPECLMRALALAHLQQARDHFARLASKSEHSKHRHYGLVLSHLQGILHDPVDDEED